MKKCLLALFLCCLLVAGLFGGAGYLFQKQVDAQLAALPQGWTVASRDVSLLSRQVRLQGVHLVLSEGMGAPLVCDMGTLQATLSWKGLLSCLPLGDTLLPREGTLTLLDSLHLTDMTGQQPQPDGSILLLRARRGDFRQVSLPAQVCRDWSHGSAEATHALLQALVIGSASFTDTQQEIKRNDVTLSRLSCKTLQAENLSATRTQRAVAQELALDVEEMHTTIASLEIRDLLLPTADQWQLLAEADESEALQSLLQEFYAEQPAFSLLTLSGLTVRNRPVTLLSLQELRMDWLQDGDSQTLGSSLRDLSIPVSVLRLLLPVNLPGMDALHINGNGTVRCAEGLGHVTGSVNVESVAGLSYAYDMPTASVLGTVADEISNLDMTLTDKGLMALIAVNISPDAATSRMILSAGTAALNDGSDNGAAMMQALQDFIARPGSLHLTSQPGVPLFLFSASDPASQLSLLRLTATPGPRTLEALVEALPRTAQ